MCNWVQITFTPNGLADVFSKYLNVNANLSSHLLYFSLMK